ncbi:hypothetical protein LJR175_008413 [Variovorax sp. LjRoot175]|uniref:hypothetical protein n=1 Tax=Variovorax sp. LjRoot175 TaxID=3342276 RepID=UPI003ECEC1AB
MEQQPSNDQTAAGGAWRAAAQAAVAHLQDEGVPANVAAALRVLAGALAAPGEVPVEAWPALTEKAQVHGTVFEAGTSTKAVVEEAIRYYLFEQQPPRVADRASVLDRFGAQVGALVNAKPDDGKD